jgi:hypothetical protein
MQIDCKSCGKTLRLKDDSLAGKRIRCPACQAIVDVPVDDLALVPLAPSPAAPRTTSPSPGMPGPDLPDALRDRPGSRRPISPSVSSFWILGAIVAIGALAGWLLSGSGVRPKIGRETTSQRRTAVRRAYSGEPADTPGSPGASGAPDVKPVLRPGELVPGKPSKAMNAYFDRLGRAIRDDKQKTIRDLIDVELLFGAIDLQGLVPKNMNRRKLIPFMSKMLGKTLKQMIIWERHEIRSVSFSKDGEEAIAYMRFRGDNVMMTKVRCWLTRRGRRWRLYDFQDLDSNVRISTSIGIGLKTGPPNSGMKLFVDISQALVNEDLEKADSLVEGLERARIPSALEGVRWLVAAAIHVAKERHDRVLIACDKAQIHEDMPAVHAFRFWAYEGKEQYEKALASGRKYLEWLGDDEAVCYDMALIYEEMDDMPQAEIYYRKGLADEPDSAMCIAGLADVLPADRKQEFVPFFLATRNLEETFELVADELLDYEDPEALRTLIDAYRRKAPLSKLLKEYEKKLQDLIKDLAPEVQPKD